MADWSTRSTPPLLEPLNIQVYDTDDRRDPEHAYLYAASTYALQFGGMRPQFRRGHDYSDRIWGALERRPESAALVSDLRRAASQAGIQAQAQDAAFLAGYLEAFGEFKEFVDYLSAEKEGKRRIPATDRQTARPADGEVFYLRRAN